jgi:hypothetical protein
MRILAVSHDAPDADWNGRDELLREEAQKVWDLHKSGMLREIWFTVPERNAVLMLECGTVADASRIVSDLPLVRAKLITFTLMQLGPYDGFDRLFAHH